MINYPFQRKSRVKKIAAIVDNLSGAEQKRLKLIKQIQQFYQEGSSIREIARRTGKQRNTVKKYLVGDPYILCRSNKQGSLTGYKNFIIKSIQNGQTQSYIAKQLHDFGYTGSPGNARIYICKVAGEYNLKLSKYKNAITKDDKKRNTKHQVDYITRKGIFNYLWMNGDLTPQHHEALWKKFSVLKELELCIRQFREIFQKKNMPLLYMFIERYKQSSLKELASFASGLEKDIEAVENAVASNLSNGFVEGTNSKVKMVKRTMYGRCNILLLKAKLMYQPNE